MTERELTINEIAEFIQHDTTGESITMSYSQLCRMLHRWAKKYPGETVWLQIIPFDTVYPVSSSVRWFLKLDSHDFYNAVKGNEGRFCEQGIVTHHRNNLNAETFIVRIRVAPFGSVIFGKETK